MYKSPQFIKRYLIKKFIYVIKVWIWSINLCYLKKNPWFKKINNQMHHMSIEIIVYYNNSSILSLFSLTFVHLFLGIFLDIIIFNEDLFYFKLCHVTLENFREKKKIIKHEVWIESYFSLRPLRLLGEKMYTTCVQ